MHVAPEGLCLKLQCIQRSVTLLDTRCNRNQIFRINNTSTDCLPVLPACHLHATVGLGGGVDALHEAAGVALYMDPLATPIGPAQRGNAPFGGCHDPIVHLLHYASPPLNDAFFQNDLHIPSTGTNNMKPASQISRWPSTAGPQS